MNVIFETYDAQNPDHILAGHYLGDWSRTSQSMLPLGHERLGQFAHGVLAFPDASSIKPLGHVGVMLHEGIALVGGYVVDPYSRGKGVGQLMLTKLVADVAKLFPEIHACRAYANQDSVGQFASLGGEVLGARIPPSQTGCNTLIDLMPAIHKGRVAV